MQAEALYESLTREVIAAIEAGAGEWKMPWQTLTSVPVNARSGKPYRGVNVLLLGLAAAEKGYESHQWGTYKAWQEAGFQVQKGEKSTSVFLWKPANPSRKRLAAEPDAKPFLLARTYNVFAREQTDAPALPVEVRTEKERIEEAEAFFAAQGSDVRFGGDRAFYSVAGDFIQVPAIERFDTADHHYATLAHEHGHWSGAESRLNRQLRNRFGDDAYAAEELVAELTAAFIGAQLGLDPAVRQDHASYLGSWLRILRADSKAIVSAASQAQKAADFLMKNAGLAEKAGPVEADDAELAAA